MDLGKVIIRIDRLITASAGVKPRLYSSIIIRRRPETFGSEMDKYFVDPGSTCFSTTTTSIIILTIMVLKLYGVYKSPFVRLVAAILDEKQVPFVLVSVNFTGEQKSPEYLTKNPYGQVPCIVCDCLLTAKSNI